MSDDFTRIFPDQKKPRGGSFARFEQVAVEDRDHFRETGKRRFVNEVHVVIHTPGDKGHVVRSRARDDHKERFPAEWAAYESGRKVAESGYHIDKWAMADKATAERLKYNNVYTVEQLAAVPDGLLANLGLGARTLRRHAQEFIATQESGAASAKLVEELEAKSAEVADLRRIVADLSGKVEILAHKAGDEASILEASIHNEAAERVLRHATTHAEIIPDNYRQLGIRRLKELCEELGSTALITTKEDAFDVIAEALAGTSRDPAHQPMAEAA